MCSLAKDLADSMLWYVSMFGQGSNRHHEELVSKDLYNKSICLHSTQYMDMDNATQTLDKVGFPD